jgi:hypothetical protein
LHRRLPELEEIVMSDEKVIITRVLQHYASTGQTSDSEVTVTRLPDNKTSHVEQGVDGGRGVQLDEYRVDGRVIWAGYSSRTGIVYLSDVRRG